MATWVEAPNELGGTARVYQELSAPLASPLQAGQAIFYASPALGVNARTCRMAGVLDPAAGSVGGGLAGGQLQAWPAGGCAGVLGWRGDSVMVGACGASAQC